MVMLNQSIPILITQVDGLDILVNPSQKISSYLQPKYSMKTEERCMLQSTLPMIVRTSTLHYSISNEAMLI